MNAGSRLCLACGAAEPIAPDERVWPAGWVCRSCGTVVPVAEGFPLFAPALADTLSGMDPENFAALARVEQQHFWFVTRSRLIGNLVQRYFDDARDMLEIGCGTGMVLSVLCGMRPWRRLVGSELHPSGMKIARQRLGARAELVQMDARVIPASNAFDVIGAFDVIEHIEDDEMVLQAMHGALRKRGGIVVAVPQHPALWSAADEMAHHVRRYRRGELEFEGDENRVPHRLLRFIQHPAPAADGTKQAGGRMVPLRGEWLHCGRARVCGFADSQSATEDNAAGRSRPHALWIAISGWRVSNRGCQEGLAKMAIAFRAWRLAPHVGFSAPRLSTSSKESAPTDANGRWQLSDSVLLITWIAGAALAFAVKHSQLLLGFDGEYMRDLARRQFEWGIPVWSASIDMYQGIGDIFFSGSNFTLTPSFIVGSWFGAGTAAKVAIYAVALTEYTLSIALFARALGLTKTQAIAAALALPLLTFPLYGNGAIYGVLSLTPQLATYIAATLLLCVALLQFGRGALLHDIRYAILFVGILVWIVHSGIASMVLGGPMLALVFFSALLVAGDWRERWAKIGLVLGTAILCSGAFLYLLGLLLNTAPVTAPTELEDGRTVLQYTLILFQWKTVGPAGPILVIAAMLGAALAIFDRSRPRLRVFAITLLTYLVSRLSFWVATAVFDFWRGPSALYFEFFVLPLYIIFAVYLVGRIPGRWRRSIRWNPSPGWRRPILVGVAVAFALAFAVGTPSTQYGFAYPPPPTELTSILQAEVSLQPPAPFRGRVANMTGRMFDRGITWPDLHTHDGAVERQFGNEMRLVGLHYFGIPGFFQYGSTMTPAFYAFTSRLLADPRDQQMRSVSVLRRYEPKLLGMLGVRFVVTDAPIIGAMLQSQVQRGSLTLYLYKVPETNVGNYSPTHLLAANNASEILIRLAQPSFEPKRDLIGDVPGGGGGLVGTSESGVVFDGVSLRVTASSKGRSVLLLPLEYSRCLDVRARTGRSPQLFRADLLLTGIVFSMTLDAEVRLREGPFVDPTCRLRDLRDLLRLGIRNIPTNVFDAAWQSTSLRPEG